MSEYRHTPAAPTRAQGLAPGGAIDAHRHDDHQVVYASRGVLSVTTDAGSWVTPGNRAIWVPTGTVHAHRAYGEVKLHLVGLPTTDIPLRLTTPTILTVGPLLRELIMALTEEPEQDTPERTRLRAVLLDQLQAASQHQHYLPTPTGPLLLAIARIYQADPADPRSLPKLGRAVGASDRTLSRLFRSNLGMTFPQWRTQLRLQNALVRLTDQIPITTIAHQCGWSSTSAFTDAFRRTFGEPPSTYREPTHQRNSRRNADGHL